MKYLIVVDVQNDFVDGDLGSKEAADMMSRLIQKVKSFDGEVIFTKDTHFENYLETQEGRLLPVKHCIKNTDGWEFPTELAPLAEGRKVYEKSAFASRSACGGYAEKLRVRQGRFRSSLWVSARIFV